MNAYYSTLIVYNVHEKSFNDSLREQSLAASPSSTIRFAANFEQTIFSSPSSTTRTHPKATDWWSRGNGPALKSDPDRNWPDSGSPSTAARVSSRPRPLVANFRPFFFIVLQTFSILPPRVRAPSQLGLVFAVAACLPRHARSPPATATSLAFSATTSTRAGDALCSSRGLHLGGNTGRHIFHSFNLSRSRSAVRSGNFLNPPALASWRKLSAGSFVKLPCRLRSGRGGGGDEDVLMFADSFTREKEMYKSLRRIRRESRQFAVPKKKPVLAIRRYLSSCDELSTSKVFE